MYIFPCKRIRYIKPIAINTHIDCANNSKCSVRYILKATKQGAFESVFVHFLLLVTKNLMHHAGRNGEHSCVPFNLNNTSCGLMLKEVDWGEKHPINSVVDWQSHETYPTQHNISEVDWGALHDSSFFLFLVNIDYDAKPKDFFTQESWGGLPERTSSTTLIGLTHEEGKLVHHLELQKDTSRLDHQWDQQWDPTQSLDKLLSSPYPDMCPNPSLSLTITLLLVGHCYYLLKRMGRDLTSTSLMAYLKYSLEIEEGFSNFISIKQYRSPYTLPELGQYESSNNLLNQWDPGEKPLLPQLFRKATASKIIYFLWIQSEYNLSCMLSKHWELLKILQVIQKLLILLDLIPLISRSAT